MSTEVETTPSGPAEVLAHSADGASAGSLVSRPGKPDIVLHDEEERMRLHPYTYVCGPMTGYPEFNHPEFNRVAKMLRDKGLKVVNPAEMDKVFNQPWDWYLRRDLAVIAKKVGRVVLLKGWQNSHGANLEKYVAEHLGCEIIYTSEFEDWYACL